MVGVRIRELRRAQGLTIQDLARTAGLSTGLISQVERDVTDPSLDTLRRLGRALDVPLFDLFRQEEQPRIAVIRNDRRIRVRSPEGGITYTRLSPGTGQLELLEGALQPGGVSAPNPWEHPSEECVVVIAGQIVVEVAGEHHELATGDSCYFDSRLPHRYVNPGDEPARFLVAVAPPSF